MAYVILGQLLSCFLTNDRLVYFWESAVSPHLEKNMSFPFTVLCSADAQSRVLQVLAKNPFVSLATFGSDDWPDVRVLLVAANDDADSLWFATSTESSKIAQLRANPKAAIYGFDMEAMAEFRLFGHVELLSDSASRRKIWRDDFIQHFPDGIDSPTMIVLRFDTDHGVYDCYGREVGKF